MTWFFSFADRFIKVPGLERRWLRLFVVGLAAIFIALLLLKLLVLAVDKLPVRFWQILAISVLLVAVVWWFTRGAKRFEQRGLHRKHLGDLGPGNPEDEVDPVRAMQQTIKEAASTVSRSPQIEGGKNPLYRVPWFLAIGDDERDSWAFCRQLAKLPRFPHPIRRAYIAWSGAGGFSGGSS